MLNFNFYNPTRIIFGGDTIDLLHKSKNDQLDGRFSYRSISRIRLLLLHELLKSKNTAKQPV